MTMLDSAYPVRRTSPARLEPIFIPATRRRHAFNQFGETPEQNFRSDLVSERKGLRDGPFA